MKLDKLVIGCCTSFLIGQTNIAVIGLEGKGVPTHEAEAISDKLRSEVIKTNIYNVIERELMDQILQEQGFIQSGCVSDECMIQAGNLIGVDHVIGGSISKIGNLHVVSVRLVNVESGKIVKNYDLNHFGSLEELFLYSMGDVAQQILSINDNIDSITIYPVEIRKGSIFDFYQGKRYYVAGIMVEEKDIKQMINKSNLAPTELGDYKNEMMFYYIFSFLALLGDIALISDEDALEDEEFISGCIFFNSLAIYQRIKTHLKMKTAIDKYNQELLKQKI